MDGAIRSPTLAIASLALVVVAACTEHGRPAVAPPAPPARGPSRAAQELVSLLDPPAILSWAERTVVADCMRGKGFPYAVRRYVPDIRARMTLAGRPLSSERARRMGYGGPPSVAEDVTGKHSGPDARHALDPAGAPRVRVRLPGGYVASAARRGCMAEARRAVYGSVRNFLLVTYGPQIVRLELLNYLEQALRAPGAMEAAAEYAACMARAGYEIRTPRAASEIGARRFGDDPEVSPAERRLAVADATCQERSRVYGAISVALVELGEDVLLRRGPFIGRLVELVRAAVPRAQRIVTWPVALRREPG